MWSLSVSGDVWCAQSHYELTTTSNAAHSHRWRVRAGGGNGGGGGVSSLSYGGAPYITGPRPKSAICTSMDIRWRPSRRAQEWPEAYSTQTTDDLTTAVAATGAPGVWISGASDRRRVQSSRQDISRYSVVSVRTRGTGSPKLGTERTPRSRETEQHIITN